MDACYRLVLYHAVKHTTDGTDPCNPPQTGPNVLLLSIIPVPSGDEESQKRAIIETAAKLIKTYIKSKIISNIQLESALDYLTKSVHCMLNHVCWYS